MLRGTMFAFCGTLRRRVFRPLYHLLLAYRFRFSLLPFFPILFSLRLVIFFRHSLRKFVPDYFNNKIIGNIKLFFKFNSLKILVE